VGLSEDDPPTPAVVRLPASPKPERSPPSRASDPKIAQTCTQASMHACRSDAGISGLEQPVVHWLAQSDCRDLIDRVLAPAQTLPPEHSALVRHSVTPPADDPPAPPAPPLSEELDEPHPAATKTRPAHKEPHRTSPEEAIRIDVAPFLHAAIAGGRVDVSDPQSISRLLSARSDISLGTTNSGRYASSAYTAHRGRTLSLIRLCNGTKESAPRSGECRPRAGGS
jgi:hypothetical protein